MHRRSPESLPSPLGVVGCPPRPEVLGKGFVLEGRRFEPKGVTYGTFELGEHGMPYPGRDAVRHDLDRIAAAGFNCVRTYTVPPISLLDDALERGIRTFAGVPWEQHVAVLDEPGRAARVESSVREQVGRVAGHPGLFAVSVGNEIPASIVRWSRRDRVERFLRRLYESAKSVDPELLVTYVNYPTTEYLDLPFLDFVTFNVYLEARRDLDAYLARLHTRAGDRPLVMGELGVDSCSHGTRAQGSKLREQIKSSLQGGCAGFFVFAWTDEWFRGGSPVTEWQFGLTTRERNPKPALAVVSRAIEEHPAPPAGGWRSVTVVVCAYQAEETIERCLTGLTRLDYPRFDVILVDDGSTDRTAEIARAVLGRARDSTTSPFNLRILQTPNRGLSQARNLGIAEARGEIVAFLDADAWPDEQWLRQMAYAFAAGDHVGMGGPNLPPSGIGRVASCVANAPGGPIHILETDRVAEHVPGCNMAFTRAALNAIRGFDPRFRVAGDDVDICWRIQDRGWTIGFCPGAVVWHLPRGTVRGYWRQQVGYGVAEALLEAKWPQKYNSMGHVTWGGRIYGRGTGTFPWRRSRIYGGTWGQAAYQKAEDGARSLVWEASAMPEWYLATCALAVLAPLGLFWRPLAPALALLALALGFPIVRSLAAASTARFPGLGFVPSTLSRLLCAVLHLAQPLARLSGRFGRGLVPWRNRARASRFSTPVVKRVLFWQEIDRPPSAVLERIEAHLFKRGVIVRRDSGWDDWDLEVEGGICGRARLRSCVEWHGGLKQLHRYAIVPWPGTGVLWTLVTGVFLASWAAVDGATGIAVLLAAITSALGARAIWECGTASCTLRHALIVATADVRVVDLQPSREVQVASLNGAPPERAIPKPSERQPQKAAAS